MYFLKLVKLTNLSDVLRCVCLWVGGCVYFVSLLDKKCGCEKSFVEMPTNLKEGMHFPR